SSKSQCLRLVAPYRWATANIPIPGLSTVKLVRVSVGFRGPSTAPPTSGPASRSISGAEAGGAEAGGAEAGGDATLGNIPFHHWRTVSIGASKKPLASTSRRR